MSNDMDNDTIVKEAALPTTAIKGAFQGLGTFLKDLGIASKAVKVLETSGNLLSKSDKIKALRAILKTTPEFFQKIPSFGKGLKFVTVGGKADVVIMSDALKGFKSSFMSRLMHGIPQVEKANYKPLVDAISKNLDEGTRGIEKLHTLIKSNPTSRLAARQKDINTYLKNGNINEVINILNSNGKIPGAKKAAKQLSKFGEVTEHLDVIAKNGRISRKYLASLTKSIQTLHAPGTISDSLKVLGKAQVIPIVGFTALSALTGDTNEAIKENTDIINEIVKLLSELSGDDSPTGRAWETKKQEVIQKLSEVNNINLKEIENINVNEISLEKAAEILQYIMNINLEDKFAAIQEGYLIIMSPAFHAAYESGSQGMAQTVGEAVDTATGWAFGNITDFNKVKELATRGATKLPASAEKIAKDINVITLRLRQHMNDSVSAPEQPKVASNTYDGLVKEAQAFNAVHNIISVRIKKAQIKKEAAAILAAVGMVAEWLGWAAIATDLSNFVIKTYISMGKLWTDLGENVKEVTEHLSGFVSVDDVEDAEAAKFVTATKQMIQELNGASKTITNNFPLDLVESFENGISAADRPKINQLSKEIVDGTAVTKLQAIKDGLQKISDIYDVLIDPQSTYYSQFDDTVESYWHGFVEVFDFLTFFSGEAAISEFKRMTYKAKRGQALANTLLSEIKNVEKTFSETRTAALEEASKPLEPEVQNENV